MDIVFLGGEVPSHRKLLEEAGVKHIGVNYHRLVKRGLPKTKDYLLFEHFNDSVSVYVNAKINKETELTREELFDFSADYEDWVAINDERISYAMEFNSTVLGPEHTNNERNTFWDEFGSDRFIPIWEYEMGHTELHRLANLYPNIGITGSSLEQDKALAGITRALNTQFGTQFHAIGSMSPENLRQVPFASVSTLAWLSPMMRGETIVWDGTKLLRYPKRMKDQARPRYKSIIEKAGLDYSLIMADDSNEITKLAIWSYLQLEAFINERKPHLLSDNSVFKDDPGDAETGGIEPDNSAPEMRKELEERDPSELRPLPVFSVSSKTVLEKDELGRDIIRDVPVLSSSSASLRQCNTCFVATNCPAFKPNNSCVFNLPVEVKTKDQLKSLLNTIIEIQGSRVAFARFAEELNGGYPDPNTSQEIDRLFKIVKQLKELEENKEFVRMTVERQTSGGVMSALFGDRANTLRELPNDGLSEVEVTQILSDNLEN
jgi:hypothetical protein